MRINKTTFFLALVAAAGIAVFATTKVRASVDTQLLALMPPDGQILLGARVDQGVSSPAGQFVLGKIPFNELKDRTGFDPRTDLREVVISPVAELGAARGTFSVSRLQELLQQPNAVVEDYRGIRMVSNGGDKRAAFLDGGTLVLGKVEAVRGAIDRWIAHAEAPENELIAKVAEVSATSQAWFAATNVAALQNLMGPKQGQETDLLRNVMQKIGAVSGQLTLPQAGGVSVEGQLHATSAADAQTLMDAYQALKLLAPPDAASHSLFQRPQVTLDGSTINLAFTMTQQEVETTLPR